VVYTPVPRPLSLAMFKFEHIQYLYALLLLIPLLLLFIFSQRWRKKSIARFGTPSLVYRLIPDFSDAKQITKFVLLSLSYVFLVLAIANPQIGTKQEKVKRSGIDVVIALDVSRSMLAEDVQPSRLIKAKNFISNFVDELKNDRIAMVVFAGRAYLQMPLSVDYSAAKLYLKTINTESVPTQGTNIGEAIDLANESFAKGDNKSKALIIISDGEDNEAGVEEALESAAKNGIKVFTLAVGTDKGSPIPMPNGDYKRDASGNIVLSKVNIEAMRNYAAKGNGKAFVLGTGKEEIAAIFKELGRINTKDFEDVEFVDFDNKFQYCLAISLLLLIIEFMISERKTRLFEKLKI
jgi:Ca-activated chloride channel family protein